MGLSGAVVAVVSAVVLCGAVVYAGAGVEVAEVAIETVASGEESPLEQPTASKTAIKHAATRIRPITLNSASLIPR